MIKKNLGKRANSTIPLKSAPLFQDLSLKDLNAVKKILKEAVFKKGEIIFLEGMACEQVMIVRSGCIKIFRLSSAGREQILEVLEPGDTCACHPAESSWACSSSAQAVTDSEVWLLSRFHYVKMVKNNFRMAQALNRIFSQRLSRFSSLIEIIAMDDPKKRLIKFILGTINHRGCPGSAECSKALTMKQDEIAKQLGVSRVTISRHLQQLKNLNLISSSDRQITILDREGLKQALL